tara:strand:+ start:75483 stop:76256 length:774 start_codon:yes stop_codon:yes gene_type:complete
MSISVKNISYFVKEKQILKDISFEFNTNELLVVLGPNGSGKSTLINAVSGDYNLKFGKIYYDNICLSKINFFDKAKLRSVMSQSSNIVFNYTVSEILEMGWIRDLRIQINPNYHDIVSEVIRECEIENLLFRYFNTLSGGEQRRVHFARTLIQLYSYSYTNTNQYIFLDEPTANLDLPHEISLIKILKKLSRKGFGVLLVLHDLNLAYNFADKIILLKDGQVAHYGTPKEIYNDEYLSEVYNIPIVVDEEKKRINYY